MPGSLADYLAKNYLTADPATERPKKKRKKTKAIDTVGSGLIIADDDPPDIRSLGNTGEDDEDRPYFDTSAKTTEFRRAKKSSWKTIGGPTPGQGGSEQEAADAILADAAAERAAQQDPDDEDALVIEDEDDGAGRMESGARGGLQTAAQTAAMVKAQEKRRKAEEALYRDPSVVNQKSQETIYRDASGRIINVAMKRAEARRAEEEKREKEEQAREALMGDVQRRQREERRRDLQDIKAMPLARTIEDEEMNEDMKARDRWNDPAAEFLTAKRDAGASVTGRPLYRGSFQPNRYGIRPGHRWDGVDRGNGFEKDWFTSRNKKSRFEALEYQWQMDE